MTVEKQEVIVIGSDFKTGRAVVINVHYGLVLEVSADALADAIAEGKVLNYNDSETAVEMYDITQGVLHEVATTPLVDKKYIYIANTEPTDDLYEVYTVELATVTKQHLPLEVITNLVLDGFRVLNIDSEKDVDGETPVWSFYTRDFQQVMTENYPELSTFERNRIISVAQENFNFDDWYEKVLEFVKSEVDTQK